MSCPEPGRDACTDQTPCRLCPRNEQRLSSLAGFLLTSLLLWRVLRRKLIGAIA